jgi:hypothetical protein
MKESAVDDGGLGPNAFRLRFAIGSRKSPEVGRYRSAVEGIAISFRKMSVDGAPESSNFAVAPDLYLTLNMGLGGAGVGASNSEKRCV